jgi:dihydrolipoamide dehydrogenase
VNERCETNVPGVYAIGDVSGTPYLAHKAYKEAEVLSEVLRGQRVVVDYRAMPSVIFSAPEIATVGLSEAQARAEGGEITIGKMPFAALGRAQALGETDGFVKLIARGHRLIGAGIVGPEASELVAELTLAIEVGASLEDLALTVHTHPTLAEAVHEAAEHALGQAVHIINRKPKPPLARAS